MCRHHGLPDERCATLGTAANMRNANVKEARFRDLTVIAVCTGGAEGNAGRAGDPASVYEHDGSFETVSATEPVIRGTINTMLFISSELTPAALVNTVMTATEAKAAALQELDVGSRYSDGLATGTGTDQIGVAARLHTFILLQSAGKHTVLGELVGKTVHGAIKETLKRQDTLTPESAHSCVRLLERFGAGRGPMKESVAALLGEGKAALFAANFTAVDKDPLVVAAVSALVHVRDRVAWGTIARDCVPELGATYGAQSRPQSRGSTTGFPHIAPPWHPVPLRPFVIFRTLWRGLSRSVFRTSGPKRQEKRSRDGGGGSRKLVDPRPGKLRRPAHGYFPGRRTETGRHR